MSTNKNTPLIPLRSTEEQEEIDKLNVCAVSLDDAYFATKEHIIVIKQINEVYADEIKDMQAIEEGKG